MITLEINEQSGLLFGSDTVGLLAIANGKRITLRLPLKVWADIQEQVAGVVNVPSGLTKASNEAIDQAIEQGVKEGKFKIV